MKGKYLKRVPLKWDFRESIGYTDLYEQEDGSIKGIATIEDAKHYEEIIKKGWAPIWGAGMVGYAPEEQMDKYEKDGITVNVDFSVMNDSIQVVTPDDTTERIVASIKKALDDAKDVKAALDEKQKREDKAQFVKRAGAKYVECLQKWIQKRICDIDNEEDCRINGSAFNDGVRCGYVSVLDHLKKELDTFKEY